MQSSSYLELLTLLSQGRRQANFKNIAPKTATTCPVVHLPETKTNSEPLPQTTYQRIMSSGYIGMYFGENIHRIVILVSALPGLLSFRKT